MIQKMTIQIFGRPKCSHAFSKRANRLLHLSMRHHEMVHHLAVGDVHDQADAKWIVIRGPLRGNNDT
jgi:hypothetical protein